MDQQTPAELDYAVNSFKGGANVVSLIPLTAALYSSIVGVLPNTVERTTTGVDASKDSPFFSPESFTTLPWNKESIETTDIPTAKSKLEKDHYGLEKAKQRILEFLAVRQLKPEYDVTKGEVADVQV